MTANGRLASRRTSAGVGEFAANGEAWPYKWALVATAAVAATYIATLAPTAAFWDASEYIATARILGIPHPPGNPLFVLMARAWHILLEPLGWSTAVRVNLFSAMASASAHGLWFLVVHRILGFCGGSRPFRLVGAFAAVLVSATAFTVWNQSNVNEKVYSVSFFTIALLSWLALRWRDSLGRGKDDNLLLLMTFVLALSVGNHLMAFLAAPALFLFVCLVRPRALLHWRLYPAVLLAGILGLSVHLFLPLRAAQDPVINEAQPTCESFGEAVTSVVTYGYAGCPELSSALKREQYVKPPESIRLAPLRAQLQNWFQYFDWQWSRGLDGNDVLFGRGRAPFTALFVVLGLLGMAEMIRRDPKSGIYMASLFVILSAGLVYYMNFKYGYSIPAPEPDTLDLHEVRERDYFFIVGFSIWGLAAGVGIATLWRRAWGFLSGRGWPGRWAAATVAPILGVAFVPLALNYERARRDYDYSARDWAHNILMSVEPYGLIFTNGDNDTFPLWYLQEVEGIRRDVTVAVTSYLATPWYVTQLAKLTRPCEPGQDPDADPTRIVCQRPYTAENTGAMYTHDPELALAAGKTPILLSEPVRLPTKSIFPPTLTDEVVDRIAFGQPPFLDTAVTVQLGPLSARLEGQRPIAAPQQFQLLAIRTAIDDRPVYFAGSGGVALRVQGATTASGLRAHVIREGVAFRLWPGEPAAIADRDLHRIDNEGWVLATARWVDVEKTRLLLDEVFVHSAGLPDEWEFWPDLPSVGIASYYGWAHLALYAAAASRGDEATATQMANRYEAWERLRDPENPEG